MPPLAIWALVASSLLGYVTADAEANAFTHQVGLPGGNAEFCCYYFYNESVAMFSHHYYEHYNRNSVCQYNIDVKDPPNLVDNCDLVMCFKDFDLDIGDYIRINHRDIQTEFRGKNKPTYPIRIWDHKVSFWVGSDNVDKDVKANWSIVYKCLERGKEHDLCNICEEITAKATLPESETQHFWRIQS